ncbi:MAG: hypothetical protein E6J78_11850 [Deltaproteobacteria bacterium]|nr:MAG: hypothetical protein E6J78_11850 [Deltaproteobacteria bacterium]
MSAESHGEKHPPSRAPARANWDNPTTVYFKLSKPFVPQMAGPPLPGFPTIDACDDHADQIERVLARGGHGRSWAS